MPYHTELAWILSCLAPMNWLNKMTQFKEKKSKSTTLGLYSYPILMAADIILYQATKVPVGKDQVQHLEIARDYVLRFNSLFGDKKGPLVFPEYLPSNFDKVMSLKDGTKKMSKSDASDNSRINLTDEPEVIFDKIKKAKTDSIIKIQANQNRPEVTNLLKIFSGITEKPISEIESEFVGKTISVFKNVLAE